jgi:hypothetical protein
MLLGRWFKTPVPLCITIGWGSCSLFVSVTLRLAGIGWRLLSIIIRSLRLFPIDAVIGHTLVGYRRFGSGLGLWFRTLLYRCDRLPGRCIRFLLNILLNRRRSQLLPDPTSLGIFHGAHVIFHIQA